MPGELLEDYGRRVASFNDKSTIKAMTAMTKSLRKTIKSNPSTLQQQLHTIGTGGAASRKSKCGRVINPPGEARSRQWTSTTRQTLQG